MGLDMYLEGRKYIMEDWSNPNNNEMERLPPTTGFFFGKSDESDDEMQEDLSVFTRALIWLQVRDDRHFRSVVYRASW